MDSATGPNASHRRQLWIAAVLSAIGVLSFGAFAVTEGARGSSLVVSLVTFAAVFLPLPLLGVAEWRRRAGGWVAVATVRRTAGLLAAPAVLYVVHGWLTGTFEVGFVARYGVWVALPATLLLWVRRDVSDPLKAPVRTALAALVLWVGLDWGLLAAFRVPAATEQGLDLVRLLVLVVALILFTICVPVRNLGYTFDLRGRALGIALLGLGALALVLVPLGLAIGFLEYGLVPFDPVEWAVIAFTLFFATTLHEEFLFRGIIQNAAEQGWRGPRPALAGLVVASVVFGLAHINNAPAPNVRYVLMATIAGLAYGTVWLRTRKVTASALTHTGVNWTWMITLRGG